MLFAEVSDVAVFRIGTFVGKGPEVVEAVGKARRVVMEFAGDGRVVAVVLQDCGEEYLAVVVRKAITFDAVDVGIAAGKNAGAGRAADGGDGVGVAEEDALFGEFIEGGSFDGLMTGAAHAIEAHFVHHDEENIGAPRRLGGESEEGAAGEHFAEFT